MPETFDLVSVESAVSLVAEVFDPLWQAIAGGAFASFWDEWQEASGAVSVEGISA